MRKMAAQHRARALLSSACCSPLTAVGIDLTALSVLGGAIGVGLASPAEDRGQLRERLRVLAERSLRIGDMVKVDGFEGRISDIRTRYT